MSISNPVRKNVSIPADTLAKANELAKANGLKQWEFVNAALLWVAANGEYVRQVAAHHDELFAVDKELDKKIGEATNSQRRKIAAMLESGEI